jgi:rhamnosyltransferase subunit B
MAHIVLTTFGSYGDLHPYMAIGLALQARGHRATIATSAVYGPKIASEGLGFHAVRPDLPEPAQFEAMMPRITDPRNGTKFVFRELMMRPLRETYTDLAPVIESTDALVTHTLSFAAHLHAERTGITWISTVLQPTAMMSIYDPPVFASRPLLKSLRGMGPLVWRPLFKFARYYVKRWFDPLATLRSEVGLASTLRHPFFDSQYSPQLNLALYSRVLSEPQPDWPPNTTITGFPFFDRSEAGDAMPEALTEFLDNGPHPIVFTLGSSAVMDAGDFYQISLEAAGRLGQRAVLLIGDGPRKAPSTSMPESRSGSVCVCGYAPYSALFPRAAAIVHQGGIGTTGQALRAGKPMLVMPFGQDQPDNADRIVRLEVGTTIPRSRYTVDRATASLSKIMNDQSYAVRAEDVAARVREENGADSAADAIEALLASRRPT